AATHGAVGDAGGAASTARVCGNRVGEWPPSDVGEIMYKGMMGSVAMPAYNEASGVAKAVRGYLALPEVDEVVVADNNSTDGTAELAMACGARVVRESRQGYGYACRASLREAAGDLIVLVEPDSTFRQTDIHKFFAYSEEFDAVFGT